MLLARAYARVLYLGDGANDLCPAMRLGQNDAVLARSTYPGGRSCRLTSLLLSTDAHFQSLGTLCGNGQGKVDLEEGQDAILKTVGEERKSAPERGEPWRADHVAAPVHAWALPGELAVLLMQLVVH